MIKFSYISNKKLYLYKPTHTLRAKGSSTSQGGEKAPPGLQRLFKDII